ncbi:MAG: FAD-dependent oxidoreductase [Firmicutes bacterium]|nr:FAD-dependent oxidoreductase [Bacillota bacterium]
MIKKIHRKAVVIGGGPAGLAAAIAIHDKGVEDVMILEREPRLGGILNQCIHDGFGLTRFGEALSGPEYAGRFIDLVNEKRIEYLTDCMVIGLTPEKVITAATREGLLEISADAVILSMGCRERPRGAMSIPGDRPSGVFTAGVAQAYINKQDLMIGKRAVILGSGDIGMIMARRLTLEGARVEAVFEILPYPSGLPRNIEQCLNDFGIPLYLSHTVTRINGRKRLESVTVSEVGPDMKPIPGTEKIWPCDTLILSVGLIPENELSLQAGVELDPVTRGPVTDENCQTSVPGIFACGNVLQVHDLVDFVSLEAESLAGPVKEYLDGGLSDCRIPVEAGNGVRYTVPRRISGGKDVTLSFRPSSPMREVCYEAFQDGRVVSRLRLKKAVPAVMVHMDIKASELRGEGPVKVVARIEE